MRSWGTDLRRTVSKVANAMIVSRSVLGSGILAIRKPITFSSSAGLSRLRFEDNKPLELMPQFPPRRPRALIPESQNEHIERSGQRVQWPKVSVKPNGIYFAITCPKCGERSQLVSKRPWSPGASEPRQAGTRRGSFTARLRSNGG